MEQHGQRHWPRRRGLDALPIPWGPAPMTAGEPGKAVALNVTADVIEAAPNGMFLADARGTILLVNRQVELLWRYPRNDLVGRPVGLLVSERLRAACQSHLAALVADPATGPIGAGLALSGLRHDGAEFPVEISMGPVQTTDGTRIIGIVRDTSEQVEAQQRLIEAERDLAVSDDRQRIASELHSRVVQRLFSAGMAAESVLGRTPDPLLRNRLLRAVAEIDAAIVDLRSTVFELASYESANPLRASVLQICAEMRPALGLAPCVRFAGAVDAIDAGMGEALLAALREALSNVVRGAQATKVTVTVSADEGLSLTVEGDGIEAEDRAVERGVNATDVVPRSRDLGGAFTVNPTGSCGTRVEWRAPAP
jgi:PAS domain S-box-containing protein